MLAGVVIVRNFGVCPFQTAAVKVVCTCHLAAGNFIQLFDIIFQCLAMLQVFLPRQHSGISNEDEGWLFDTRDNAFFAPFSPKALESVSQLK